MRTEIIQSINHACNAFKAFFSRLSVPLYALFWNGESICVNLDNFF